ncbi:MAG: hypothetical protein ABI488_05695 [Polyangiaceae bacterium]
MTASALRAAADSLDAVAAADERDPARVLSDVHAIMAGPLVGGLMVDVQDRVGAVH